MQRRWKYAETNTENPNDVEREERRKRNKTPLLKRIIPRYKKVFNSLKTDTKRIYIEKTEKGKCVAEEKR